MPVNLAPSVVGEYIKTSLFTSATPAGGQYDWDEGVFGLTAAVSLRNPTVGADTILEIDKIIDDGNLSTGVVFWRSGALMYVIEG